MVDEEKAVDENESGSSLEPSVPKKYKKPGRSYREICADMLLDQRRKRK